MIRLFLNGKEVDAMESERERRIDLTTEDNDLSATLVLRDREFLVKTMTSPESIAKKYELHVTYDWVPSEK